MKKILLLCLFPILLHSQTEYRFFINNISMPINNKGVLGDVNIPPDGPGGRFGSSTFMYSGGFLISGFQENTLWSCGQASSSLLENFIPGNVDSSSNNPVYKIYVNTNSQFPDYSEWQEYENAVYIGADFYDGNGDGIYDPIDLNGNNQWDPNEDKPDILGDKMTWCVYNDGVPGNERARFAGVNPVGIEVRQSIFGYSTINELSNVIFIRYKLINNGSVNNVLDSIYFSCWTDPDLGVEYYDDLFGSDIDRNSCFVYNSFNTDPGYGSAIPSFFTQLLQGPISYIPGETYIDNNSNGQFDENIDTPLDTAYNRKGKDLGITNFPGAKNLLATSSIAYLSGDPYRGDPDNQTEAFNYSKGKLKTGSLLNPCSSDPWGEVLGGVNCNTINPLYWYSGDPVTNIGWINYVGTDQRILLNSGPFKLTSGKPVNIIVAYIVGQGADRIESITKAREIAEYTHNFYLSNFGEFPVGADEDPVSQLPVDFRLEQNYPNPFNPSTKISWQSPVSGHQTLKVYDVLGNEVATLVNEFTNAGNYKIDFNASALSSGVYFYKLQAGSFIQTKKMILIK